MSTPLTTGLVAWSASEEDLDSGDTGQSASKRSFRHDLGCQRGGSSTLATYSSPHMAYSGGSNTLQSPFLEEEMVWSGFDCPN